ncbi:MAG: transposase [Paludibacteraceae bacterium]|nr:transposase [Paludibacteraceae bacterium]
MTKEQFLELQKQQQSSGVSVKDYCHQHSISYSSFNYWRKKYQSPDSKGLVPLTVHSTTGHSSVSDSSGLQIQFPNGVQVEFGSSSDSVAIQMLTLMCGRYV